MQIRKGREAQVEAIDFLTIWIINIFKNFPFKAGQVQVDFGGRKSWFTGSEKIPEEHSSKT
ncbi:MAG: hypothetical protein C0407_13830 [Desulfobacca sp.]|nr:hypothetical protein [Desulfobacca sp.]